MTWLLLGLVLFLGAHSVRVFAEGWRGQQIERWGEKTFKGLHALVSLAGFVLLCWGYDLARSTPAVLWVPPVATRHGAALLMLLASVLMVAALCRATTSKHACVTPWCSASRCGPWPICWPTAIWKM